MIVFDIKYSFSFLKWCRWIQSRLSRVGVRPTLVCNRPHFPFWSSHGNFGCWNIKCGRVFYGRLVRILPSVSVFLKIHRIIIKIYNISVVIGTNITNRAFCMVLHKKHQWITKWIQKLTHLFSSFDYIIIAIGLLLGADKTYPKTTHYVQGKQSMFNKCKWSKCFIFLIVLGTRLS